MPPRLSYLREEGFGKRQIPLPHVVAGLAINQPKKQPLLVAVMLLGDSKISQCIIHLPDGVVCVRLLGFKCFIPGIG